MKIKLTSVHVDDQERALRFYTEVLGFVKKADFTQGSYRWLTVASPEELIAHLAVGDGPEAWSFAAVTGVLWVLSYFSWRRLTSR